MIQVNKEFLRNASYIKDIVEQAKKEMRVKQIRYDRYTRKGQFDLSVPLEYYIVNIASGYFGAISPQIKVKQETNKKRINVLKSLFNKAVGKNADEVEFQILIDHIREYNDDSSVFYQLVKDYFITGSCYALQYETVENKLVYARVNPMQTVALYDYNTPIEEVGLIRIWNEVDDNGESVEMVEVITNKEKIYFKGNRENKKGYLLADDMSEKVNWLLLPAFSVENPDGLAIFSVVEDLIDALETVIKNNRDTFAQNADAKLVVKGFGSEFPPFVLDDNGNRIPNPDRIAEDKYLLTSPLLRVTGDKEYDTGFEWLIKDINDTASENHKKTLIDFVLMLAMIPNVTDVGFTNADNASALEKKFFPLEQVIIQAEKLFKKEYQELFENFVDRINTKYGRGFDASEIDITFKRNLPANNKEIVDTWLALRGLLADETIITNLPFELDVESEKAKLQEQDEVSIVKFSKELDDVDGSKQITEPLPETLPE